MNEIIGTMTGFVTDYSPLYFICRDVAALGGGLAILILVLLHSFAPEAERYGVDPGPQQLRIGFLELQTVIYLSIATGGLMLGRHLQAAQQLNDPTISRLTTSLGTLGVLLFAWLLGKGAMWEYGGQKQPASFIVAWVFVVAVMCSIAAKIFYLKQATENSNPTIDPWMWGILSLLSIVFILTFIWDTVIQWRQNHTSQRQIRETSLAGRRWK